MLAKNHYAEFKVLDLSPEMINLLMEDFMKYFLTIILQLIELLLIKEKIR